MLVLAFTATLSPSCGGAEILPSVPPITVEAVRDSEELARLYEEDQSDRKAGLQIDWEVVGPRDKMREARVKELYTRGQLRTGKDYHRAAMVLQHAQTPEDYLLAHEPCVIAIFKGVDARWLAAASEDRFLRSIGRPQRFGTQCSKAVIHQLRWKK